MSKKSPPAKILICDDKKSLTTLFEEWLNNHHTIFTASNGNEATHLLDETIDFVILDRQMPKMTGDEVLTEIKDRNLSCRVIMVTAIEPDMDLLKLGCDEYLTKPIRRGVLCETLERLRKRSAYDEKLQAYFELLSKKAILETSPVTNSLFDDSEYVRLESKIESFEQELGDALEELDDDDLDGLIRTQ